MAEDIDAGGPPPEDASNRTFLIAAASLGGLFLVGLICVGVYALFINPKVAEQREATAVAINATNTAIAQALTQTQQAGRASPVGPIAQATLTPSPVIQPTDTPVPPPSDTPTLGPTPTATSTTDPRTATALARTGTPRASPTALPETGFADEAGLPALVTLSLILLGVLVVARTLRLSNAN